jgi:dihydroneopterin triphosphate diphosphatase
MARAPFQALVYPYYKVGDGEFVYALLKRSDAEYWQAVAGGGEDNETPIEAARRETHEETGISQDSLFLQLDTVLPIPVTEFRDSYLWGDNVYVIPQYCFGVWAKDKHIVLSHEHTDYRWLKYKDAQSLMRYEGNKIALWELDRKLRGQGPRD